MMFDLLSKKRGGSSYLTNLKITNYFDMLLFAPIKVLYFWISPVPWEFRGVIDIISFLFDSIAYIYFISFIYKNRKIKINKVDKVICIIIILGFLFSSTMFAFGTFNSGTALRHRNKLLILCVIVYSILKNKIINLMDNNKKRFRGEDK